MKTRSTLLFAFLICFGPELSVNGTTVMVGNLPGAVAACNQAYKQLKKGDMDGAIQSYSTAFRIDPRMYVAVYERGTL